MLSSIGKLTVGNIVAYAATVAVSPLLTRLYTPAQFGILGVITILLALMSPVVSLRYEQAVPVAESERDADLLVVVGLLASAAMSVLLPLLFFAGVMLVPYSSSWGSLGWYTFFLIPALWFINLLQIVGYWCVRRSRYGLLARANAYGSIGAAFAQASLGVAGAGSPGLVGGYILGQAIASCRVMIAYAKNSAVSVWRFRESIRAGLRYKRFPLINAPAALLNGLGLQLPYLLFAFFYGPAAAGLLILAQRVSRLPIQVIAQSVGQAYYGHVTEAARDKPAPGRVARLSKAYWSTSRNLFLAAVLPTAVFAVAAPFLFGHIFGHDWREAGVYSQAMLVAVLAQFVVSPVSLTLVALDRQELQLIWEGSRLVATMAPILVMHFLNSSPVWVLFGISLAQGVMYALLLLITGLVVHLHKRRESAEPVVAGGEAADRGAAAGLDTATEKQDLE